MPSPFKFPKTPPQGWAGVYVGTPWVWQGRASANGFAKGLDCWGLLLAVYPAEFGLALPDWAKELSGGDLKHQTDQAAALIAAQTPLWTPAEGPALGAVVLMRDGGRPGHVGICVDARNILHASRSFGSVRIQSVSSLSASILGYYWPRLG